MKYYGNLYMHVHVHVHVSQQLGRPCINAVTNRPLMQNNSEVNNPSTQHAKIFEFSYAAAKLKIICRFTKEVALIERTPPIFCDVWTHTHLPHLFVNFSVYIHTSKHYITMIVGVK